MMNVKLPRRRFLHLAAGAAALPVVSRFASAQTYPTRPVRVIVPYAPGGPTDIFARLLTQKLGAQLGKQFYVENIGGAGGNIGTGQAARAAADGHTILITVSSHVINAALFEKLPYDPYKDFQSVTLAITSAMVFSVNPSVPAATLKDLVDLIRANPGKYNFASGGTGTQSHLSGEQFRVSLGLDLVHVPFTGGGPSLTSTVAGHTPILIGSPPQAVPHIKDGKLRALAVTTKTRTQALPDVPTMAEAGFPDIYPEGEEDQWVGVFVPTGTSKDIVALLHREIIRIINQPDMKERWASLGFDLVASTPEELDKRIKTDIEAWRKLIRTANIKPQ